MQPFKSILVDIDSTARVHPALDRAARVAKACHAQLKIVDVVCAPADARSYLHADLEQELTKRAQERLSRIAAGVSGVMVDFCVLNGRPALALIQEVLRHGHDLLVRSHVRDLVAHGPRPFGPVGAQLFRQCPCPVWAIGAGAIPSSPRIVGAVRTGDDDPTERGMNAKIIDLALFMTDLERGSLVLLEAWQPFAERSILSHTNDEEFSAYLHSVEHRMADNLRSLKDSFDGCLVGVELDLHRGEPENVIPEYAVAQGIDTIVMGTMARTGIVGLLFGNAAERLLKRIPCSVLVVKPDSFVSPVRLEQSPCDAEY